MIELLVVVAIVALLASIILPGLARAREYAYFTSCKNSLRQIVISVLNYAVDNRGKTPEGEDRCKDTRACGALITRALGLQQRGGGIWVGSYSTMDTKSPTSTLLRKIYSEQLPGGTTPNSRSAWEPVEVYGGDGSGFVASHLARPRMPGRYMPIELMWDPITKVRNWGPWGGSGILTPATYNSSSGKSFDYYYYAGTERQRDFLTRKIGVYGYAWFMFTSGCQDVNGNVLTPVHVFIKYGGTMNSPNGETKRDNSKFKNPHTSNKGSVWLAACQVPIIYKAEGGGASGENERFMSSHFGFRQMLPGWRYNVVHLDGHVHDQLYRYVTIPHTRQWGGFKLPWIDNRQSNLPYGWQWVKTGGSNNSDTSRYGHIVTPGFAGAFDEN